MIVKQLKLTDFKNLLVFVLNYYPKGNKLDSLKSENLLCRCVCICKIHVICGYERTCKGGRKYLYYFAFLMNTQFFAKPKTVLIASMQGQETARPERKKLVSKQPFWKQQLVLLGGFCKKSELYLPKSILTQEAFDSADLLILTEKGVKICNIQNKKEKIHDFFTLNYNQENQIYEIHLVKDQWVNFGGIERNSFKTAELVAGKGIEILINTKSWHSYSGRRQTIYYEYCFFFQNLGAFTETYELETYSPAEMEWSKEIYKQINLRKILY